VVSPRAPSSVLVIDANIVLSAVLGRRLRLVFQTLVASRTEVTSALAADEVQGVARGAPGLPRVATGELVETLLGGLGVVDEAVYADLMERVGECSHTRGSSTQRFDPGCASACLYVGVRCRSMDHDRTFAGTGRPSWSNANLNDSLITDRI
jgi:hypothetical protein